MVPCTKFVLLETAANSQTLEVKDFFDGHAKEYREKYQGKDKFYQYFFFERLEAATYGIDFSGMRILDVGCGTGPLYDYLTEQLKADFQLYKGTDIAPGMLEQSNIPSENQHPGRFTDIEFNEKFDLIFMLGVTTYLAPEDRKAYFEKIKELLALGGKFIVTFTHRRSLDIRMRQLFAPIRKALAGKNRVMAQDFKTWYYSKSEIERSIPQGLSIDKMEGLNHTIFPISRLVPPIALPFAKWMHKRKESRFKQWLSSDLIIKIIRTDD